MKFSNRRKFLKTAGAIITGSALLNRPNILGAKPLKKSKKNTKPPL